jgi:enoyl-CoA hydratase/carnithine racemase
MIELTREGDVFVLRWSDGENRFRPERIEAWHSELDKVEAAGNPAALVTTGAERFYSNGLDLEWLMGEGKDEAQGYIPAVLGLIARVLSFPTITVAAMNGHAFGAGAQIALAHDFRVMRSGRGYFCMPEIDMGSPLHPGMTSILRARLSPQTVHEMLATGHRYSAEEAQLRGIVEHVAPEEEVVARAIVIAQELASKAHPAMKRIKSDLYAETLVALALPMSTVT